MATTLEADLFAERILEPVGREASDGMQLPHLTGFLAMEGNKYSAGGLMVVGRAVNGWTHDVSPAGLTDNSVLNRFKSAIYTSVNCPMTWVTNQWGATDCYNSRKSAFWRVIREVTLQLCIAEHSGNDWSSHLVWSNLYKLSPRDGGNPSGTLQNIQLDGCRALFDLEIETYRPGRLLLLTGWDWAEPFLAKLRRVDQPGGEFVERTGQWLFCDGRQSRVVVSCHPQGKSEKRWVREVLHCLA